MTAFEDNNTSISMKHTKEWFKTIQQSILAGHKTSDLPLLDCEIFWDWQVNRIKAMQLAAKNRRKMLYDIRKQKEKEL